MRRRALTFDLVGLCRYEVFNSYHSELLQHLQHLQEEPPPGYNHTSLIQVLRADRAAFLLIAEQITSLKRNASGELPLEKYLPNILSKPSVSFHLLPLATSIPNKSAAPKANPNKRKHEESQSPAPAPNRAAGGTAKGKESTKERIEDEVPTFPRSSSANHWRAQAVSAYAGPST